MKILEINKFNYLRRGAERHFLNICSMLREKGHEVAVFAMHHPQNKFSPWQKYFISYVGYGLEDKIWHKIKGLGRMFFSFEAKRKISKLLREFQPEIAHIHNIYHQISPSILTEIKKRGIPVVMTVHDYKLICPNYLLTCGGQEIKTGPNLKFWDFVRRRCFKNSFWKSALVFAEFKWHALRNSYDKHIDLYIAPSQFAKNKLAEGGIPEKKIIVLPHFAVAQKSRAKDIAGESGAPREKYAFYCGDISREKGVDRLIAIFQNLPEIKLYLAGSLSGGFEFPKAENIRYLGFLQRKELEKYLRGALFAVSASRLPETFGLIALEALQNAKPFIGFRSGALPEIIENNREGFLCENENEFAKNIMNLAADPGLRMLFSHNAVKKFQKFGEKNYYRKIMEIFEQALTKNSNRHKIIS